MDIETNRLQFSHCAVLAAFVCLTTATAHARTWRVNAQATGDAPTVQAAIDSTTPGDTVLVAPGTYSWTNQSASGEFGMIHITRDRVGFVLLSEAGAAVTILDAQFQGRGMFIAGQNGIVVDGFTFTRGLAPAFGNYSGGAIAAHLSNDIIRNCIFRNNQADFGAGLWCGGVSSLRIVNCEFFSNQAVNGGGVYFINSSTTITISDCYIHDNVATDSGGAVSLWSAACRVEFSVLEDNSAGNRGGAISGSATWPSSLYRSTIVSNSAPSGSGIHTFSSQTMSLDHCIVANGGSGEWMTLDASTASVACCDNHGNVGGNGLPAGTADGGGNISLDPLFCGVLGSGNYYLRGDSPCAPGEVCGQMGAFGVGCGAVPVESTTWGRIKSRYGQ